MAPGPAGWGAPPWPLHLRLPRCSPPSAVDFAIVGGGFTGLATACWLRRLAPERNVAVLEANRVGAGSSGRTGGLVLDQTAAGDLPGLGDVLGGFAHALQELGIECNVQLGGVWEIARRGGRADSPIAWRDSGLLRVAAEEPGGCLHPGKLLAGLASTAAESGACLLEGTPVQRLRFGEEVILESPGGTLRAHRVLLAVNGSAPELLPWVAWERARFTLAVATAPLSRDQQMRLGLLPGKPFYTLDLPYLWGRPFEDNRMLFGGGLVGVKSPTELARLDISAGEAAALFASLEQRLRGLVAGLGSLRFTHRWGGPILFSPGSRPLFAFHPASSRTLVLGGYTGQGVALSVYLARWAAEVLLERRAPPPWGAPEN